MELVRKGNTELWVETPDIPRYREQGYDLINSNTGAVIEPGDAVGEDALKHENDVLNAAVAELTDKLAASEKKPKAKPQD